MRRRDFLQALGVGAASLALPAGAQATAPPKRFLVFMTPQGCAPNRWRSDPLGLGDVDWSDDWTAWSEQDFSDSLRPLFPWRDRCAAVAGLGLVSAAAEKQASLHALPLAHALSGANAHWSGGFPFGGGPTVDQLVAAHLARPDRHRSLELSIHGGLGYALSTPAPATYAGALQPLPPVDDPLLAWRRLFGGRAADPLAAHRATLLSAAADRHSLVGAQLGRRGRDKLDLQGDLLRDLEVRLFGLAEAQCAAPPDEPAPGLTYDLAFAAQADLITAAFACDLTRVATLQMGQPHPSVLALPGSDFHTEYAHRLYADPVSEDAVVSHSFHQARLFTRLLERLDAVPDDDGSLLDNTVVVWMSELGDAAHGLDHYPVVVAGGANTRLRTGRYVNYARTTPVDTERGDPADGPNMGVPHQRLLVTLCQALGMNNDSVGVREVVGRGGARVDCTGSLPELLSQRRDR